MYDKMCDTVYNRVTEHIGLRLTLSSPDAGLQISAERYMQAWTNMTLLLTQEQKDMNTCSKKRIEDERRECAETAG